MATLAKFYGCLQCLLLNASGMSTGRQSGQKLQGLYTNPISNNFFQN